MRAHSYGVIPITKQGEAYYVLIIQQREGHWSFPKGTPEQGEEPIDTAQREFSEETGIEHVAIDPDTAFTEEYSFREVYAKIDNTINKKVTYFLGWVDNAGGDGIIENGEIIQSKWLTFKEAEKVITFKEARSILEAVAQHLTAHPPLH